MPEPLAQPKQPKLLGHPSNVANALERKYRETLGEIKKLEAAEYEWVGVEGYKLTEDYWRKRLKALNATLIALEKSIRMFDPKWTRKSLMMPKVAKGVRSPLFPRGKFKSALVKVLREASPCATLRFGGANSRFQLVTRADTVDRVERACLRRTILDDRCRAPLRSRATQLAAR